MLRVDTTIFATRPDGALLRKHLSSSIGFRLLRHKTSGVYFLDPYEADFDTSAFSILKTKTVSETKRITADLLAHEKAGRLQWGCYRIEEINDAIWLSDIFQTRVMITYFDDDGSDMVAVSYCGDLERASIHGSPIDEEGQAAYEIEILGDKPSHHREVKRDYWNDIFEREFKSLFGHAAPDLTDLERTEFEKVDEEAAILSQWDKIYDRHQDLINVFLLPFILAALLWSSLRKRFSALQLAAGILLLLVLLVYFQTRPSAPQDRVGDKISTEQAFERLCKGDIRDDMRGFCEKLADIERQKAKDDPK